jgi:Leucine-rich repeat (LRR) protein
MDLKEVEMINIQDNAIEVLPEVLFGPKHDALTSLNIGSNRIKVLPGNFLAPLKNLKTFIANRNRIEHLPKNLFDKNLQIEFINFSNNFIKSVETNFALLNSLKTIFFYQNNCSDSAWSSKQSTISDFQQGLATKCTVAATTKKP